VIGENMFSPICVSLATDLGYTNPKTNTGQGNRKAGISMIANSGCGPTTLKASTRHSHLDTTAGTYHKSNMEDQLRGSLAVQGTTAEDILNPPPPLLERQRSQSVPPPSSTNQNPLHDPTVHPAASFDTIDSSTRPTSIARQDSSSGSTINHGRGTYTMNYQSCLSYVSNTVIRSAVSIGTRSVSFQLLYSNILFHFQLFIYYVLLQDGVNPCQRLLIRSLLVI
jgi:hypothetical protein